jgi:tetratricopeptide (TPR) repeat protein
MRNWGKPAVVLGCVAILAAHAYGTHRRNLVWRTDESLWLDVTQKSPENGRGLMNYGLIQMERGKWKIAEDYFERALQYAPYYSVLHINIGILKGAMGKPEDAEHHFHLAQQYDFRDPMSYFYYARWLYSTHRGGDALAMVRRALELSPANLEAQDLMRHILAEPQELQARTAPEIAPEHWLNLSVLQFRKGDYKDAIESSRQALRVRPDYAAAYNNICAAENARGAYIAAADACRRAVALQPDFTLARNNLAFAVSEGKSR